MDIKPCRKCGSSDRYANGACRPCGIAASIKCKANINKKKTAISSAEKARRKLISNAAWRAKNKDHIREYNIKYEKENSRLLGRIRLSREEKKRKDAARAARWYEKNKEKVLARIAMQYAKDPAKYLASSNSWKSKNKEKRAIQSQNRRVRVRSIGGKLSSGLVKKLLKLQKGKCACCKQPLGDKYHIDHIMPIARGGSNTDDNIQLLTPTCNMRKNAKHPIDFMQEQGLLL